MRLIEKNVTILTRLLAVIILITLVNTGIKSSAASASTANAVSNKTDRLFRDMGIIRVPRIAPPVEISLLDIQGKKVTLSDFKGKIVFLNFWTTWCPECRIEMPLMEKLHKRLKDKDFAMVAVNLKEPAIRVKNFFSEHQLTFTALLDSKGKIGARFGVRAVPTTFILDKEGGIIGKVFGSRKWNSQKSIALFEHLINNTIRNANVDKHQQKKSISSHSVKPGTGTGNPAVNPAFAC
jgi:peroxiredoxin